MEEVLNEISGGTASPFFLIAGPCVVESEKMCLLIADELSTMCKELEIPFVFKASYKKANRSRLDSFTGIGDIEALEILSLVRTKFNIPVTTDIHTEQEATLAAKYVDILQIPAFLCRQTELLVAAAKTGKVVNIKKGQFLNHEAMKFPQEKVIRSGNSRVILTERGNSFGYNDLIVDFAGLRQMSQFGKSVVIDCTHSLQKPNQSNGVTGGQPEYIETIAKCGLVSGVSGLFIETHPDPENAKSDGANMLPLLKMRSLLEKLVKLSKAL